MAKSKKRASDETAVLEDEGGVGRGTLETTPERALQFLRAIGTSIPIRSAMMGRGYSAKDHREGWDLLRATSGFVDGDDPELEDVEVRDAIQVLDAWDEDGLRIVRATLRRRHPEVAEFVLRGLEPAVGTGAVLTVGRLIERLDTLKSGKERRDSRREDRAALDTLASRGIDDAEIERLRGLVSRAQSARTIETNPKAQKDAERSYLESLRRLRSWYEEWSDVARSSVKRRDHLIRLGLASRRSPSAPQPPADEERDAPS